MIRKTLNELLALYAELPVLSCKACGTCCVSPTCTLVEFIFLMQYCLETMELDTLKSLLLQKPQLHPHSEGNTICFFLKDGHCSIHPGRTGACRLYGIPLLSQIAIENLDNCKHGTVVTAGRTDHQFISEWLDKLVALNTGLYAFDTEPYYVRGFTISCWLDVYFDDSLTFEPFDTIRSILRQSIDLSFIRDSYKLTTGLKEKIDKISILGTLFGTTDLETINELVLSINEDYPFAGTYFFEESVYILKELRKITEKSSKDSPAV